MDTLAATLPPDPGLLDLLTYQGIGLAVVLTTLAVLALICTLMGRAFARTAATPAAPPTPSAPEPGPPAGIPPHHTVIIAAAVATLIQEPYRIAAVRHIEASPDWTRFMLSTWSVEGRAAIFSSHRTR